MVLQVFFFFIHGSLVAQTVKRLSTMQETWVWSLGREDPLEKEMAIHSSTIAWKIPWTDEPDKLQSTGLQRVGHDWATSLYGLLLLFFFNHFCSISRYTLHSIMWPLTLTETKTILFFHSFTDLFWNQLQVGLGDARRLNYRSDPVEGRGICNPVGFWQRGL